MPRFEVTKTDSHDTTYIVDAEDEDAALASVKEGVRTGRPPAGLVDIQTATGHNQSWDVTEDVS